MKKIAFALQAFSLLMIVPLCVVIEMNHAAAVPTKNTVVREAGRNVKLLTTDDVQAQDYNDYLPSRASVKQTSATETFLITKN